MPGPRYTDWTHVHVVGDRAAAAPLVPYGRKQLGYLAEQASHGGRQAVLEQTLEDGSVVRSEFIGSQPRITITPAPPKGGLEEVLNLYVSTDTALRVYDVGRKALVRELTGLGAYTLQLVSLDGGVAWLTGPFALARVDIAAAAAFGFQYAIKVPAATPGDPVVDGFAETLDEARAGPERLLVHFHRGVIASGVVREGVGGWLLVDAKTLAPLRAPIRMSFDPHPATWRADGQRFYLACSRPEDVGDIAADARLSDLTTSTADYVAAFDADGTLLGTRQLATWGFTPDSGFFRLVSGMVANATRLYVTTNPGLGSGDVPMLLVLDATDDSLPVLASLPLNAVSMVAPHNLCLTRDGATLLLGWDGTVAEVTVQDDALALGTVSAHADFAMWTTTRGPDFPAIQLGPESRAGGVPDNRRWVYNYGPGATVVRAYRDFAPDGSGTPHAVYDFDLATAGVTFKHTFRLASVGVRPRSSA